MEREQLTDFGVWRAMCANSIVNYPGSVKMEVPEGILGSSIFY